MNAPYRFLHTGIQDAAFNMAIDEAVLVHHLNGDAPPTLRVFRWSQPTISLGRFQNVEREILGATCRERGVALVRRPTGGRAVYHFDEFTYSIVIGKRYHIPSGVVAARSEGTRLNSSHPSISYAVFCLKKKNKHHALFFNFKKKKHTKKKNK